MWAQVSGASGRQCINAQTWHIGIHSWGLLQGEGSGCFQSVKWAGGWDVHGKRAGQSKWGEQGTDRGQMAALGAYLGTREHVEPRFEWSSDGYVNGMNILSIS